MISVALCTYNGVEFIKDQLDSILNQTRPVDEIIVSDDGSSDGTLVILKEYAEKYSCLRYSVNAIRKGFKQNFFDTMRQCKGDLVFLSDQDDRWHPNKVESVLKWFGAHPKMQLVFTNANIIDGESHITGETLFEKVGFDSEKQKAFCFGFAMDILCLNNRATGATMAVRRTFIYSFNEEQYRNKTHHDYSLALDAADKEVVGFVAEPLMDYRLHENNTTGLEQPQHLFLSPYMPVWTQFDEESIWTKKNQQRLAFSRKRLSFKHSWFGVKACIYVFRYIRLYGKLWYMAFAYDWKESVLHSRNRLEAVIKRKMNRPV